MDTELLETEFVKEEEIEKIVLEILGDCKETSKQKDKIEIVAIEQESSNMEYYIYLSLPASPKRRRVQISLVKFSTIFKKIFEEKVITNTALCFIADGSCGLSNIILGNLLSKKALGLVSVQYILLY